MARIVRKFQDEGPDQLIMENVTVAEAKSHCSSPDTHGDGWFDVYYLEEGDDEEA